MEALGADVRLEGQDFDAAREACEAFVRASGARYVRSMNEPLLIAGAATCWRQRTWSPKRPVPRPQRRP
jgi:threonine dehydratase